MTRLRWALARLFAPVPVVSDPYPGEDGVFVWYRKEGFEWTLRAERFRLKSTTNLARLDFAPSDPQPWYRPSRTFVRFVGTVAGD